MEIRTFQESDRSAVVTLWRRCELVRPQNDPDSDIDLKMSFQPELFLVGVDEGSVIGTVMGGYEGHRGWINYLAVDPDRQSVGLGATLMEYAEAKLRELGCVKINLQVRSSNEKVLGFYRAIGYLEDDVISMGKRLS
ncbi:GNAT family acetyltransferase [Candidatus Lucifugimonas marina]|uniref:GNAT family acetyltransferase n=2 Tax=Candidatus Lucifugimonas marina TaxID=3038979 RepID=A0AAJ6CQ96_9CHLR|nr:GNAT family acetyltransferase [SAR202 cluster bacterium JH639]WFG34164.1 GNAT family acetyltransferase [SAR202 cluster bacterium JH545]WFG38091.1 GNAT family acetyltransferase [SAR202 cluster bacterium JH1073]